MFLKEDGKMQYAYSCIIYTDGNVHVVNREGDFIDELCGKLPILREIVTEISIDTKTQKEKHPDWYINGAQDITFVVKNLKDPNGHYVVVSLSNVKKLLKYITDGSAVKVLTELYNNE
jgi:hypothetical protein